MIKLIENFLCELYHAYFTTQNVKIVFNKTRISFPLSNNTVTSNNKFYFYFLKTISQNTHSKNIYVWCHQIQLNTWILKAI